MSKIISVFDSSDLDQARLKKQSSMDGGLSRRSQGEEYDQHGNMWDEWLREMHFSFS